MKLEQPGRLTDVKLRALAKASRSVAVWIYDRSVPGLSIWFGTKPGSGSWYLLYRVVGEGGTTVTGRKLRGKKDRLPLGHYPAVSLEAARAAANTALDQAKRGINPKSERAVSATAGGL